MNCFIVGYFKMLLSGVDFKMVKLKFFVLSNIIIEFVSIMFFLLVKKLVFFVKKVSILWRVIGNDFCLFFFLLFFDFIYFMKIFYFVVVFIWFVYRVRVVLFVF